MNEYCVSMTFFGQVSYEDPKCPWNWRGSGVYIIEEDIEVPGGCYVTAESEERAEALINEYAFNPPDFTLDSFEIDEIKLVGPVEDDASEEIYDVTFSEATPPEPYEPDTDEEYEREKIRRWEEEHEEG